MVKQAVCSFNLKINNRVLITEKQKTTILTESYLISLKINNTTMPSSTNKDYDVEKIVAKRTDSKGRTLYLIKWKGIFQ
jgi:hypothetical protein